MLPNLSGLGLGGVAPRCRSCSPAATGQIFDEFQDARDEAPLTYIRNGRSDWYKPGWGGQDSPECVICQEPLHRHAEDDTRLPKTVEALFENPECGHCFHRHCLEKYLKSGTAGSLRCPICKRPIDQAVLNSVFGSGAPQQVSADDGFAQQGIVQQQNAALLQQQQNAALTSGDDRGVVRNFNPGGWPSVELASAFYNAYGRAILYDYRVTGDDNRGYRDAMYNMYMRPGFYQLLPNGLDMFGIEDFVRALRRTAANEWRTDPMPMQIITRLFGGETPGIGIVNGGNLRGATVGDWNAVLAARTPFGGSNPPLTDDLIKNAVIWTLQLDERGSARHPVFGHIDDWNVSAVTDMSWLFSEFCYFNQSLSRWDVSNVKTMGNMFRCSEESDFAGDLSRWNVSNVEDMRGMFSGAVSFNSDLSRWDVGKVKNMEMMFAGAFSFNADLSQWNVGKVTNMKDMFFEASSFTSDLSRWNVGKVTNMEMMFYEAESFNSDLSRWDVSKVTEMRMMFKDARKFTGSLRDWNVNDDADTEGILDGSSMLSESG